MFGFFDPGTEDVLARLIVATVLGLLLGTERVIAHKTAGMRTFALVSLGAALFIVISEIVTRQFIGVTNFDPLRVAAHVVTGIGFLGAGILIVKNAHAVQGVTTAAGLWVAAGIGIASGFGLYLLAVATTLIALFIFTVVWFAEYGIKKISGNWDDAN
ncbi:MAG: MgtC/SapB family protein [Parcubacteria group bacterium]|nr:MgtC/SapB family protein [Parcubacteria group bacterium]